MKHILYLPSWFPSRKDPYPGDFIKRHAESASLYNRVTIFYTAVDKNIQQPEIAEEKVNENLSIYIYYYPKVGGALSSVINGVKRFNALRNLYDKVFKNAVPDLVHVHVAYPAGLFALYLRKRKRLDYIISEHDGIYMPNYDNHHVPNAFERKMVPVIYKNAIKVHAVSKSLADALMNSKLATSPIVIPNVVDIDIFKYRERERRGVFSFVHVSSMINQKNPEGMLEAILLVKKKRSDFKLKVIGPVKQRFIELAKKLGIEDAIEFVGEISYHEVAKEISNSDAMIHFTRYETFGCVIAESLSSGVPVIVSDLDVTKELVTDHKNGIMVKEANVQDLADKIIYFMESGFTINAKQVAEETQQKFNYQRVGKMFDDLYRSLD